MAVLVVVFSDAKRSYASLPKLGSTESNFGRALGKSMQSVWVIPGGLSALLVTGSESYTRAISTDSNFLDLKLFLNNRIAPSSVRVIVGA